MAIRTGPASCPQYPVPKAQHAAMETAEIVRPFLSGLSSVQRLISLGGIAARFGAESYVAEFVPQVLFAFRLVVFASCDLHQQTAGNGQLQKVQNAIMFSVAPVPCVPPRRFDSWTGNVRTHIVRR